MNVVINKNGYAVMTKQIKYRANTLAYILWADKDNFLSSLLNTIVVNLNALNVNINAKPMINSYTKEEQLYNPDGSIMTWEDYNKVVDYYTNLTPGINNTDLMAIILFIVASPGFLLLTYILGHML